MAFKKDITLADGSVVKHWRVAQLNIDYQFNTLTVTVRGWLTKALFNGGATNREVQTFTFSGADFPLNTGQNENTLNLVEAKVLTMPYFSGALAD